VECGLCAGHIDKQKQPLLLFLWIEIAHTGVVKEILRIKINRAYHGSRSTFPPLKVAAIIGFLQYTPYLFSVNRYRHLYGSGRQFSNASLSLLLSWFTDLCVFTLHFWRHVCDVWQWAHSRNTIIYFRCVYYYC